MEKVQVTEEEASALNSLGLGDSFWAQYFIIGHSKNFSGNGICMGQTFTGKAKVLNGMAPLDFARCVILGYEVRK